MTDQATGGAAPAPGATTIDTTPPPVGTTNGAGDGASTFAQSEPKKPTIDDTLEATWDRIQTGNERGPDGRFASKPNGQDTPTNSAAQPQNQVVEPAKAPAEPTSAIDYPHSWAAEGRELWSKLPPEFRPLQEQAAKRDSESFKLISSQGERLKSYEPLDKLFTEFKPEFDRYGHSREQGIKYLLEAQRMFDANPLEAAIGLLLQRGIDLRPLLSGQQGSLPAPDPRVGQVEQRLNQLQQNVEQQLEQQRKQQTDADQATVQEFAKGKPYFEEVRPLMASFLRDGHAETLQAAYDMAVAAHPTVSKRVEADKLKTAEEKRKQEEDRRQAELKGRAQDAAKAAKLNVKSSSAHPNPKSWDDTLEEAWNRAQARS